MNCKVCNTRIPRGASKCPNCGLGSHGGSSSSGTREAPAPRSLLSRVRSRAKPEVEVELDLNIDLDLEEVAPPSRSGKRKAASKSSRGSPRPASPARPTSSVPQLGIVPKRAELRAMLAARPALLERGLIVHREGGKAVGENYATDVGSIDLLARDEAGGLVVVMIAESDSEDIVSVMLQRIGWVSKHLGKPGQEIRGVVLAEQLPEGLEYAAAAVADTVTFKTYEIALTFTDANL